MRKPALTLIVFLLVFNLTTPAFGWGSTGHKTIGQIAQLRLANTNTLVRINNILRPGETLSSIATWADDVKDEENFNLQATNPDPDTQHFYRHLVNRNNRTWHFVDLPLGCSGYGDQACQRFTSRTDIVQLINLCIRRLRGDAIPNNAPQLTTRNALRMLVHLVGDLHQPLHVGVGFVNVDGPNGNIVFETDPSRILENDFPSDRGGNDLLITGEVSDNLHSFWDADLVNTAKGNQSLLQFSNSLNIAAPPAWNATGNAFTWAAQWAGDTLSISRNAYRTIEIQTEVIVDDRTKYTVTKGDQYTSQNVPVVRTQLAKGGYRLARLLQAIFP
jgi:hypothetical protein